MAEAPQQPIAPTLRALQADLRQQVWAATRRAGSVYRRGVKGNAYLYAKIPVGNTRLDVFIGRADGRGRFGGGARHRGRRLA
jgi:hypothetical protein